MNNKDFGQKFSGGFCLEEEDACLNQSWLFVKELVNGYVEAKRDCYQLKQEVENLKNKMHDFSLQHARLPSFNDLVIILGIGFGFTSLGHFLGDN